jgi:hypothetical protein
MPPHWAVNCKKCNAEFIFHLVDEQYPRETVNNMQVVDPPKPALRKTDEVCPHCGDAASYKLTDLIFRPQ